MKSDAKQKIPSIVVVAGPNGAGKSTFYDAYLRRLCLPFVNADNIARFSGCDAQSASMIAESLREKLIKDRAGFVFETVFSDKTGSKIEFLKRAVDEGYDVSLIYIGLSSWKQSEDRVSIRVAQGGHDVSTVKLRSRYGRTLKNLARAIVSLPDVIVYDNSPGLDHSYRLLAKFKNGKVVFCTKELPLWFESVIIEVGLVYGNASD